MITNLQNLKPGSAFRVFQMPDLSGVLVDVNECSAKVKLTSGAIDVEIDQPDGSVRRFTANRSRTTIWSPATVIETIDASAATSPPAPPDAEPAEAEASNLETDTMKTVTKAKKSPKARKPKATNITKGGGGTRVRSSAKTTAEPKVLTDEQTDKLITALSPPVTEKKKDHPKTKAKVGLSLLDAAAQVMTTEPASCEAIIKGVLDLGIWNTSGKTPGATLYSALIRDIAKPDSRFARGDEKGTFKLIAK